ncbi:DNA internalization-related competence protein ComEC/Rec2 [Pseudodesulfovibrio sediminis]|uniref:Competence protein ComEC n=1 Tax=Pseudodesulfovibrio sediminis TaxID=2810563 RepID=A0ABN6ENF3_9BACT|nr:DNA internalization-related competence protein ComEC/Rec2 [Pseudodesulfovibrio sediminis]BCS87743.1 competence protein ComEC [Pseudodesulfovibrio sediminis]
MKDTCWTHSPSTPGLLPWQSYTLAFVIGLLGVRFAIPALVGLVGLCLAERTLRERACRLPVLALICCVAFGFGYASQRTPELSADAPSWVAQRTPAVAHGVVDRVEPLPDNRLRLVLSDVRCEVDGVKTVLPGKMMWSQRFPKYRPAPGQTITARLRVVPVHGFGNPGSWDYGWYWQRQGVFWRAWPVGKAQPQWGTRPEKALWELKSGLRQKVAAMVSDTQGGAMVLALVTGDRSRLTSETMDATRHAGLAHTLALSGLHVGFVAAMGVAFAFVLGWLYPPLLLRVPRPKLAVLLAAPLVLGYTWLGQPSASLIRAATMYCFWGYLVLNGRGRVLMDGLFFALLVILFVSPLSVFDLSLQMSAVAVAGIGVLFPYVRFLFTPSGSALRRFLWWAGGLLSVSVCANIALLPLISWYFGTLSPNIVLNLLWLPVLGFVVMPLGLAGMLLSSFAWTLPLASVLFKWASTVMDWLLSLLHGFAATGMTPVFAVLRPLWPEMLGFGLLLVALLVALGRKRTASMGVAALGFVLLVGPHLFVMVDDSRDEVRLTMLDVGLGQSLVVSTPGGRRWLVDGGGGSKTFDLGEAVVAPSLTQGRAPRLEGVFMTHPDVDHSHGLPFILARFDVGALYTNGMLPRGRTGKRMRIALDSKGIVPESLVAGERVRLDESTVFSVVHPHSNFSSRHANERSLVMRLVRDGRGLALLPGDVEKEGLKAMRAYQGNLRSEVLILPHHGSKSSFDPRLYDAVSPRVALASNGYLNRYGFPHQQVVDGVGSPLFITSTSGQIVCVWRRGEAVRVRTAFSELQLATSFFLR